MLRAARADDLAAVHRIYVDERVNPFLSHEPADIAGFAPAFETLRASGLKVWEQDGAVAGFCRALRFEGRASHVAQLGALAVDPALHGHGVAVAMLEAMLRRLRAEGVVRVELLAEADNPRGLAFYRKMGFVEEGVQLRAFRRASDPNEIDEILMVRFLDQPAGG